MKKLLLILLFLSPFFSEAQTSVYHPFPDSNAVWCGNDQWFDGFCDHTDVSTVYFGNDTLLNGNIYHTLRKSGYVYSSLCGGGNYYYYPFIAAIRQDTLQHTVFMYDTSTAGDTVFYNFNLQLGDTLDRSKVWWGNVNLYIVSSVDSIMINGLYRKRYNYNTTPGCPPDSSIIEGIGGTSQLMSLPSNCFEYYTALTSFEQNGIGMYPNASSNCDIISGVKNFVSSNYFHIYPNPAHNLLNVECNLPNAELKIYDVMGRVVYSTTLNSKHQTLNPGLSPAVYFVRVSDGEKMAVQKLVVE
jgi:hypothetical protein